MNGSPRVTFIMLPTFFGNIKSSTIYEGSYNKPCVIRCRVLFFLFFSERCHGFLSLSLPFPLILFFHFHFLYLHVSVLLYNFPFFCSSRFCQFQDIIMSQHIPLSHQSRDLMSYLISTASPFLLFLSLHRSLYLRDSLSSLLTLG